MRIIIFFCLLFSFSHQYAQVAINTSGAAPHSSTMLDVSSTNKGVLIPGVSLTSIASASPVTSPANGLLIWNTNASLPGGSGTGLYYWDGVKWQSFLSDNTGWRLGGNSATNPALHFIGTTDNQPLRFKVNNADAGKIDPTMNNLFLGAGAGANTAGGNAKRNTFVGDSAGYSNTTISDNSFFGYNAGHETTTGFGNSFFGSLAGSKLATGNYNSFFGHNAGRDNTSTGNSFFGDNAGMENTGANNSFFGRSAGVNNLSGTQNSFFGNSTNGFGNGGSQNCLFGYLAGAYNEANRNSFVGYFAGHFNNVGHHNSFLGSYAGYQNNDGNFNVYLGDSAGYKSGGSFNTLIGSRSNTGSTFGLSTVSNSTAIGYLAQVDTSNGMVLGSINGVNDATTDTRVGIGITKPKHKLHVVNNNPQDGGWAEGIVIESVTTPANAGEAGLSFRNVLLAENKQWTIGLNQNPQLAFNYGSSFAAGNTRMVIDTLGNVGIGTATPAAKLDVNGTAVIGVNGTVLTNIIKATANVDLDSATGLPAGASLSTSVAVANAAVGSTVFVSPQNSLSAGSTIAYARVSAAGTIEIRVTNGGIAAINQGALNVYITVIQ